jgi:pectin methylesterase-like acyl-CoA thioesterase
MQNSYDPSDASPDDQAVAVRISGDRCAFYNCIFLGYQDTVLDESGKHYFENCYIEGAIDIICGNGKSLYKVNQIEIMNSVSIFSSVLKNHNVANGL